MMTFLFRPPFRTALGAALALGVIAAPVPGAAQDQNPDARLRKIEAEVRALQRKVFPGGDGRYFEPQIAPGEQIAAQGTSGPSTTAVTDILARIDAMELQLQRLTARGEELGNALAGLEARMEALESSGTLPAPAITPALTPATTATAPDEELAEEADEDLPATSSNLAAMGARSASAPAAQPGGAQPGAAQPSPERVAAVQAIAKPHTGDAGDDEYSYGFRLWNAGFYPEARQQLAGFVEQYPDHWRATYGRNLLGRAFLDDGQPEEAARWFLKNYQTDRTAERAPDSLLYLARSMIALGDTRRACIALAEFGETYPAAASGRLMEDYEASRRRVTCE
ncbi:MAG: tetratricopeptide repeat protein [Erythrobacter sp.]|jgi:TolA-binding protein|nr:tetratricopeptide repeat protein [Erythrobacter sp.]